MADHLIVVEKKGDITFEAPGCTVVRAKDYITRKKNGGERHVRVINLCRNYRYLELGYYCSLLAEARQERPIPSVATLLELSRKAIYRSGLVELDAALKKIHKRHALPPAPLSLSVFFGQTSDVRFEDLARKTFELFRCPLLRLDIAWGERPSVAAVRTLSLKELTAEEMPLFEAALRDYTRSRWRARRAAPQADHDLAILFDPKEALPPSSPRTLQKFVAIGAEMGIAVDLIQRKDYSRLAEYDALFIRETTALDNHTYRFAKRAESEGMVVIDDPQSILRCTNKVYLAELLKAHRIRTPKTIILTKRRVEPVEAELGYPIVLKIPDGSFSRGVLKATNRDELLRFSAELLRELALILAQEYMYTEFDWRVGILNGQPIFVCQYFMSKKHWQVVKHGSGGKFSEGAFKTLLVEEAPPEVVRTAVKAAALIGNGLYGVDLKQTERGVHVIEINDNPNIDQGIEDARLKDELYRILLREFVRRLEARPVRRGPPPNGRDTSQEPIRLIASQ